MADTLMTPASGAISCTGLAPSLSLGDPYFNEVVLSMHMDGANGSTTFTDVKGKTVTTFGNAQISTAQSKFGGASGLFDGSGDYLTLPHSTDLNLSSGDWTIEAWVRIPSSGTPKMIVCKDGVVGSFYPQYYLILGSDNKLNGYLGTGAGTPGTNYVGTTVLAVNTWYHVAMVKTGSTCKGFVNGNQEWSSAANSMADAGRALYIGNQQSDTAWFNGHIDDLRLTKGVARYTANFIPPSQSFSDVIASFVSAPLPSEIGVTGLPLEVGLTVVSFPGEAALVVSGQGLIANVGRIIYPGVGSVQVQGNSPSLYLEVFLSPGVSTLGVSGIAPVIVVDQTLYPVVGQVQVTGNGVAITQGTPVNVGQGAVTYGGFAPSLLLAYIEPVGVRTIPITGYAPTLSRPVFGSLVLSYAAEATAAGELSVVLGNVFGGQIDFLCDFSSKVSKEQEIVLGLSEVVSKEYLVDVRMNSVSSEILIRCDSLNWVGQQIDFYSLLEAPPLRVGQQIDFYSLLEALPPRVGQQIDLVLGASLGVSKEVLVMYSIMSSVNKEMLFKYDLGATGLVGKQFDILYGLSISSLITGHNLPVIELP